MPKISIIIPVYNTEPYLCRCLDSVLHQTLQSTQVICINDGSTDGSLAVLNKYAAKDKRIDIIDFSCNQGVSAARNAGLAVALGEYLGFVDSDDAIDSNFYTRLCAKADATNADIVKGVRKVAPIDGVIAIEPLNNKIRVDRFAFSYQWTTAIYRSSLIRNYAINFPLGVSNSEDAVFLTKALSLAGNLEIVDDAYYHVFRRIGSLSQGALGYEKIMGTLNAYEEIISFINTRPVNKDTYHKLFFIWLLMCCNILATGDPKKRPEMAIACAETALRVYNKCKHQDVLSVQLKHSGYGVHEYLETSDVEGLANYLLPKTLAQRKAESIRFRLKESNINGKRLT